MTTTSSKPITLEEFLQLPETKPASEFIAGEIIQKPMPKGRHSRLQGKLSHEINLVTEDKKIAYAFPELRCTFANRSIVPDIAVFRWQNIPFLSDGQVPDRFSLPPNWVIEVLSPEQKSNQVIAKIVSCLENGSELGWLIDPDDESVLVFWRDRAPSVRQENDVLPVLAEIELELTANQLFSWLKMGN
ncbi:Uma2 family endonuclease [Euhalothece natronophila Z-M001]|uniref:Uma2 family endonuclease n=1 Tax=Euhalothece natronophila Z-M001 TaxID=522448 RepID=A0A5B8NM60_9CHRO|nr:Uma2 family endonuclease [Euhalothece natronophila]QDZ39375.1 Uma2 family endonuclease [Euhalothece natronophila Z-M001]